MKIMQDEWVTYLSLNDSHHSPHEQNRNRDREREGEREIQGFQRKIETYPLHFAPHSSPILLLTSPLQLKTKWIGLFYYEYKNYRQEEINKKQGRWGKKWQPVLSPSLYWSPCQPIEPFTLDRSVAYRDCTPLC